jgi:hypothetical protein
MVTHALPGPESEEVAAWLWLQREEVAESWDAEAEPRAGEDFLRDPVDPTPAVARWCAAELHREALLREWERAHEQLTMWQGVQTRILADSLDLVLADGASRPDASLSVRSFAAELACAVGMSDRTLEARMNDAQLLRDRFPATFTALREGRMSRAHAQVVLDAGARLTDDSVRDEYEDLVLQIVAHLTTGRLRSACSAIAEQLMPTTLSERHEDARAGRRLSVREIGDGMAELWVLLPSALAYGIQDRLTQFARTINAAEREAAKAPVAAAGAAPSRDVSEVKEPRAARTMDQVRVDVLCDVLLTGHATTVDIDRDGGEGVDAIRGVVQITIPVQQLVGAETREPATLAGHGAIDPETARSLASAATIWDRVFTDPISGAVVAVDRRFPAERQRRYLKARDEHCRFPGCRQPVWRCDIDHTIDHQHGGPTAVCNLAHLCRRHHTLKHQTPWKVQQQADGALVWTSPLGRVYTDKPPATLRFVPSRT